MKSQKNLTRFTYENSAFVGWRLCISRTGSTFTKYFSDKKYSGENESFSAAEKALTEIKEILRGAKKVNGKLGARTVREVQSYLGKV